MKKKTKAKLDVFHLSFIGEFVELLCDFSGTVQSLPFTIQGYILDVDDKYYYISDNANEITKSVDKDSVKYIEVIKKKSWKEEVLEDMDLPSKEEDIN